ADGARDRNGVGIGRDAAFGARHHRNAELLRRALGLDLVAHDADMLGLRADEMNVVLAQDLGKARILRKESVARMHRVGAGDLAGGEDRGNVEIAFLRRRRADAHALVGEAHMHRVSIGGGMHGDGRDAELLAGAQHPHGDLAAIGDQDLVEHHSMIISGSPNSTGWPSSNRIWMTVPPRGAGIWFIVFIASMMSSVSPALTVMPTSMN